MTRAAQNQLSFGFSVSSVSKRPIPARAKPADREPKLIPDESGPETAEPSGRGKRSNGRAPLRVTAETMAKQQREISVSEFFAKNRHLLGFDNKRKALLTTVKEAVDNSLDACEEAGILPELHIEVTQTAEERFRVVVRDNGPGIVKQQIPNVFGKLLYGSKFHRLKMARGQQGIGISAAGMYGLITTGKPISIISRPGKNKEAHHYKLAIDTKKNRPDIMHDESVQVDWDHGTRVEIELEATYNKGRQSIDEYIELTAIANPHARIVYKDPGGQNREFARGVEKLPPTPKEIKPHPHGIELGTLMKMLKETSAKKVGAFLQKEFSRVSGAVSKSVCSKAGITPLTWVSQVDSHAAERLYQALQSARIMAPSTDCLAPIGAEAILSGLLKGIKAEFYTASTRSPSVYRGNPFQVEVGMAYGGDLESALRDGENEPAQARVIRFANRVPLLYRQSACCTFKAVLETKWNNYGLSQSRGALPQAPAVILIHFASVWVPFTSESKEAIADYDEIRKEIKLGIAECGRKLGIYLGRKKRRAAFTQRRDVFTRYIHEVVESTRAMATFDKDEFRKALAKLAERFTAQADLEMDEHGKVIKRDEASGDEAMENTLVVPESASADAPGPAGLFDAGGLGSRKAGARASAKRRA